MTYKPSTFHAGTGEDFFRKEGILIDGMDPLISGRYTFPAFTDYDGTQMTVTNSKSQSAAGAAASWSGYNLAAAKTKLLAIVQTQPSTSNFMGIGFHTSTLPTDGLQDSYENCFNRTGGHVGLHEFGSGSVSYMTNGIVANPDQAAYATSPVCGLGLFVDADNDIQKAFFKSKGEWIQVASTLSDTTHSSFQSVYLSYNGENAEFICPIMVWGS